MDGMPEVQCYPITILPHTSALFRDYADMREAPNFATLKKWYPTDPFAMSWAAKSPVLEEAHRERLASALAEQARGLGANEKTLANIEKLRAGAAAVVTGQQVGLFGGPLLTLLKAATAVRKAQDATRESGREHVPVFWLASEDHDLAEVDQVALPTKTAVETLKFGLSPAKPVPVGGIVLGEHEAELERAAELLGWAPIAETLRECYTPGETLAGAFAKLMTKVFAEQGLIILCAASREMHSLGAKALRYALEHAGELETALLARSKELQEAGYHAQVLVVEGHSLLFLIDAETGARLPLRRNADGEWKAGQRIYTLAELMAICENEPERLSPNALLRAVFQDCILPTAAYVGGPAEIAYFAQSAVVYEKILGRVTPVLPRLSATLVDTAVGKVMEDQELTVPQVFEAKTAEELGLRMGARAMPIAEKRKLAAVGNAMDTELTALIDYVSALSPELGRSADVSASKMRYQMNRLRRMAARFEVQKQEHLQKHANAIMLQIFPEEHPQERLLAGVWALAKFGDDLPALLVEHAGQECPGHRVIFL